jgi:hypothetical protein
MAERLEQALKRAGVEDPPSRVEWFDLAGFHMPNNSGDGRDA